MGEGETEQKKLSIGNLKAGALLVSAIVMIGIIGYGFIGMFQERADLNIVSSKWTYYPQSTSHYVRVSVTIFNRGDRFARDTELTITIYDYWGFRLKTEVMNIGDIPPRAYESYFFKIQYSGNVTSVTTTLMWSAP